MIASNRIDFESTRPTNPNTPRSAAQAEASRKNGAKSRGPKTFSGKAKSSRNAIKHSILAQKVLPSANAMREDREYLHQLRRLKAEFRPRTQTALNWVETLAYDWVKLTRVMRLQEVVLTEGNDSKNTYPLDDQADCEALDRLIRCLGKGRRMKCDAESANRLATAIHARVDDLLENLDAFEDVLAEGQSLQEDEVAELNLARSIEPTSLGATDRKEIRDVLLGRSPVPSAVQSRWLLLLETCREMKGNTLEYAVHDYAHQQRADRQRQMPLLERLPTMELLQRYEVCIRRRIEATTRTLEEMR